MHVDAPMVDRSPCPNMILLELQKTRQYSVCESQLIQRTRETGDVPQICACPVGASTVSLSPRRKTAVVYLDDNIMQRLWVTHVELSLLFWISMDRR